MVNSHALTRELAILDISEMALPKYDLVCMAVRIVVGSTDVFVNYLVLVGRI